MINYNLFLFARLESVFGYIAVIEILIKFVELDGFGERKESETVSLAAALALAAITLNGLEKLVSYRLQSKDSYLMRESNPIARLAIRRFGLLQTHVFFLALSVAVVCATYAFLEFSSVAIFCLWLELLCSAFVFFNNWVLERLHSK